MVLWCLGSSLSRAALSFVWDLQVSWKYLQYLIIIRKGWVDNLIISDDWLQNLVDSQHIHEPEYHGKFKTYYNWS